MPAAFVKGPALNSVTTLAKSDPMVVVVHAPPVLTAAILAKLEVQEIVGVPAAVMPVQMVPVVLVFLEVMPPQVVATFLKLVLPGVVAKVVPVQVTVALVKVASVMVARAMAGARAKGLALETVGEPGDAASVTV